MKKYYLDPHKTFVSSEAFNDWDQKIIIFSPLTPIHIFRA